MERKYVMTFERWSLGARVLLEGISRAQAWARWQPLARLGLREWAPACAGYKCNREALANRCVIGGRARQHSLLSQAKST